MFYRSLLAVSLVLVLAALGIYLERNSLPETDSAMRERAWKFGEEQGKEPPPHPFYFDGCTLFPDSLPGADYTEACLEHDIAYWYGGTAEERRKADVVFRQEVAESGPVGSFIKYPMYWAVRALGDSLLAEYFDSEWGFGYREE